MSNSKFSKDIFYIKVHPGQNFFKIKKKATLGRENFFNSKLYTIQGAQTSPGSPLSLISQLIASPTDCQIVVGVVDQ